MNITHALQMKARAHNLISEGEIFDYLWLMVKFGAFFDLDVNYEWLNEYIDGDPDNLMQGKTIHGVDYGEDYLRVLYFPKEVWLERFKRLKKEYLVSDLSETRALQRVHLLQAAKSYNPDDSFIIQDDILEKIYAQIKPQELEIQSSVSHALWFILSVDLGYRFYDNPLFSEIREILNSKNTEQEKVILILDIKIKQLSND